MPAIDLELSQIEKKPDRVFDRAFLSHAINQTCNVHVCTFYKRLHTVMLLNHIPKKYNNFL